MRIRSRPGFRLRLHFRPLPFVLTVLLVALGISLGQWQERRAAYKIALQATLSARQSQAPMAVGAALVAGEPLEYRPVSVSGEFVRDWPIYLDNRPYQGKAGFYVLMPLRIADSDTYVLVERGWLARNTVQRDRMLAYTTPPGQVTIEGIVKTQLGHVMQLGTAAPIAPNAILQNLDTVQFAAASKYKLQPFVIEQRATGTAPDAAADGLVRDWPAPALGVEKHQGYAFQWYALACMAFLFFVITGFRRGTKQND